ncbi:hypothetical protein ABKN59_010509 [Abortiporus biennis]
MDKILEDLYHLLHSKKVSLTSVLNHLLWSEPDALSVNANIILDDLLANALSIVSSFSRYPSVRHSIDTQTELAYAKEMEALVSAERGWHFSVLRATSAQVRDFKLEDMAATMEEVAPGLTRLFDTLILARDARKCTHGSTESYDNEDEGYWDAVDGIHVKTTQTTDLSISASAQCHNLQPHITGTQIEARRKAIRKIRWVAALSTIMLTSNQKCNALASIIGIFCHAHNVPEKVIDVLSRLGVSISVEAINDAITSLSAEAMKSILGSTLLAAYAYDNFDVDLKISQPRLETSTDTLKHLTSGLLFPLPKCIKWDDLKCAKWLWETSRANDEHPDERPDLAPAPDFTHLLTIHPEHSEVDSKGMSHCDRWNAWKLMNDLFDYGPLFFRQFKKHLSAPEVIDQVLMEITRPIPARSMDIPNSTVKGNIETIAALLKQAGIGDPENFDLEDIDPDQINDNLMECLIEYAILFHGDLGTGEKISAAQLHRIIEESPIKRYQFVIFVLGLFHLKMACADAIWCMFIKPVKSRTDPTSVMAHIRVLRLCKVGKYISNPGFRRMHQLITHDGRCRRLDCWRVAVEKKSKGKYKTLEEFAASNPSFKELKDLADYIAMTYVATLDSLDDIHLNSVHNHDKQYENSLVINQYYLLYKELSYAMNIGDIGRVELSFAPWVFIFRAIRKHKYASAMVSHITNVFYHFPKGLKKAIRYSILINLRGLKDTFRAVDWVVELNNLYTKTINVTAGPNKTVENIIKESTLINVFRDTYTTLEKNLVLNHLTTLHAEPDMSITYHALLQHMERERPHEEKRGRSSDYMLCDMIDQRFYIYYTQATMVVVDQDGDVVAQDQEPAEEDVSIDLFL